MSWVAAKDISQWQGDWRETGEPIVLIKCGGGDNGLYFDSKCTEDYNGATTDGRAVGLYWFIGWAAGAEQEAAFMLRAVSPLADNDVYALDTEKGTNPIPANAVQYVTDMVNYIKAHTNNTKPLLYMNLSTLNSFDWSPLLQECGLWLADWAVSPDANIPTHYTYVMQQYSDGPNYDHDAWFGTVEEFKAYGYHAPQTTPTQVNPTPPPQPVPQEPVSPIPTTVPETPPQIPVPSSQEAQPNIAPAPVTSQTAQTKTGPENLIEKLKALFAKILKFLWEG